MMEEEFFPNKVHALRMLESLQATLNNPNLVDGTVVLEDGKIPICRAVVAAGCPYFRALYEFSGESTDHSSAPSMVYLEQINKATFQYVLDFIYTGRAKLHYENIQDLLQAADLLLMEDLKNLCINYLLRQIEPGNCLGILQFARRYSCPRLEYCAKKFICGNFREMTMSEEFQFLTEDQVVSLLEEDGLQIHSEREVLFALVHWIKHNKDKNPKIRGMMEKCLRYGLEYSDLKEACHDGVTKLFKDGWDSLFGEHKEQQLSHRPRGMMQAMIFADGGLNEVSRRIWAVDLWQHNRDYRLIKSFHVARRNHRIVAEGGYLFVIGGLDAEGSVLASGEKFDQKQEKWMPIAPMTTPRCHFGLVSHAGKLYAIGGKNDNRLLKSVEEYDIYTNKWRSLPELSLARKDAAYAVCNNKIFVIGGQHISESEDQKSVRLLESTEMFNIKDELWVSGPPPQEERFGAVAVGHADCVYLFGGVRPLLCPASQGLLKTCGIEYLSPWNGLGWLHHGDPDISFKGNTFLKAVVFGGEIVVISRKHDTDDGSLICHMMKGWGRWNMLPRLEVAEEPADCAVYDLPLSTFSKLPTVEDLDYPRFLILSTSNGPSLASLNVFKVHRDFVSSCGKPRQMWAQANGSLVVELTSKSQFDKVRTLSTLASVPVHSEPHSTFNSCVGVVNAPRLLEYTDSELLEGLADQKVTRVYRPKETINGTRVPSSNLILTFARSRLPSHLYAGHLRYEVHRYYPRPRRCFNCQRFGHVSQQCRRPIGVCVHCSAPSHGSPCSNPANCANCGGNHAASSSSCIMYLFEREVLCLQDSERINLLEARTRVRSMMVRPGVSYEEALQSTAQV